MELFKQFTDETQGVRRKGAAAVDLCHVALGIVDAYWCAKPSAIPGTHDPVRMLRLNLVLCNMAFELAIDTNGAPGPELDPEFLA